MKIYQRLQIYEVKIVLVKLSNQLSGLLDGGFRGGGAQPARVPPSPPLFEHFSINAPLLKPKKKKKVSDSAPAIPAVCYITPPPPRRRWCSGKKKSVGGPPHPPLISFFGTCASFETGRRVREKNSMLCPPFLKFLDPPLFRMMLLPVRHLLMSSSRVWEEHATGSKSKKCAKPSAARPSETPYNATETRESHSSAPSGATRGAPSFANLVWIDA